MVQIFPDFGLSGSVKRDLERLGRLTQEDRLASTGVSLQNPSPRVKEWFP